MVLFFKYIVHSKLTASKLKAGNQGLYVKLCRILHQMSESAFQKIIPVRNVDFALLDESAYYENIYAGGR